MYCDVDQHPLINRVNVANKIVVFFIIKLIIVWDIIVIESQLKGTLIRVNQRASVWLSDV